MDGFDILGAVPYGEYLVGAATNVQPTVSKLNKAASRAAGAAAKLQRINPRAAAKLRAHSSTAISKGKKLSAAALKAAKTVTKPPVAAASPAVRAAAAVQHTAASPRTAVQAPARTAASRARSHVGLTPAQMAIATSYIQPMLDVYNAFANAVDDAGVAGEVMTFVQPLVVQMQTAGRSDLVSSGNALVAQADAIINSVSYPADPVDPSGATIPGAVGSVGYYALVGEISDSANALQVSAMDWIKSARGVLATAAAAPAAPPAAAPVPPLPTGIPLMPDSSSSGGGGGGGGGGGADDSGGAHEEGGAPDEGGAPPDEGAASDEGGAPDEGEASDEATDGMASYSPDGSYQDEEGGDEDEEGQTVFEALEESMSDEVGGGGGHGGGGHGGGGHGGHGHGGFGGHRGMRGGWGGWYGGPWYDGYDVLLEDDDEELADKIAKKVAQRQWAAGGHHVGYAAPDTHWYTVATPGAIKEEMDKIFREGDTLNNDIMSFSTSAPSYSSFKNGWASFWASYKKFYDDNSGVSGWLSRLWSASGDQVVGYGNQLNDWRAKFKQFPGAQVTEPSVTAIVRREDPTATNWKPYVIGLGVVAGVGVLGFGVVKIVAAATVAKRFARG